MLNLPLGEDVAIRVVGFSARDAGFIDNVLAPSLGGTFDNAEFVEGRHQCGRLCRRAARRCAGTPNENWTVDASVVYQQMDAGTYGEDNVLRSRPRTRRVGAHSWTSTRDDEWTQVALTLQGDLGFGAVHVGDQLFHARHLLLPGQHGLHVLPDHEHSARTTSTTTSAPTRSASAGATATLRIAVAQEFRLQGATEKTTWLAGVVLRDTWTTAIDFYSRVEDYEDTPSFDVLEHVLRRGAGHDRQRVLPLEQRPDHRADRRLRRGELLAERALDADGRPALVRPLRASAITSSRPRTATSQPRPIRRRPRTTTSDITKKLSVQYNFNERHDGLCAVLGRLPRRRPQRHACRASCCRRTTNRISSTTTSSASRAAGPAAGTR